MEDKGAWQNIKDTTTLVDEHYGVYLLWKRKNPQMPDDRPLANKRAESLRRGLIKQGNEELVAKYRDAINDYMYNGYTHRLTPRGTDQRSPITTPLSPDYSSQAWKGQHRFRRYC